MIDVFRQILGKPTKYAKMKMLKNFKIRAEEKKAEERAKTDTLMEIVDLRKRGVDKPVNELYTPIFEMLHAKYLREIDGYDLDMKGYKDLLELKDKEKTKINSETVMFDLLQKYLDLKGGY